MSVFKQKRELESTKKRLKATGASVQEIGRVQYKINQLTANPKGNAVKASNGSTVKTSNGGTVRTKPTSVVKKKRATPLKGQAKAPTGHPSGSRSTVTTTGLNGKKRTVAAGSGKTVNAVSSNRSVKNPRLHAYVDLSTSQLRAKANVGDKRAASILKARGK